MTLQKETPVSVIHDLSHVSSFSTRRSLLILRRGSGRVPESEVSTTPWNLFTPPDTSHTLTPSHSNPSNSSFNISSPPPTTRATSAHVYRVRWPRGCLSQEFKAWGPGGAMR